MDTDVLIIGQGLAGSALGWRLAERGVSVVVVDRGGVDERGRPSASRVAAGLITPVTGKRLVVAPEFNELRASARAFYRSIEQKTGAEFLHEQPAVRVFVDGRERELFEKRTADPVFRGHARLAESSELPEVIPAPWGGFVMPNAARLDVRSFLRATREWLAAEQRIVTANLEVGRDLVVSDTHVEAASVGVSAARVVLCQGHAVSPPSWTRDVPLRPAKGEVIAVDAPQLGLDRVLHRGVWIAPCESGVAGRYRVGSTVDWKQLDSAPTSAARAELLEKLAAAGVADARVVHHQAAVRPATPDRQPTFGTRPEEPRVGWLNGLGSKGSLWAPWAADRLAERLVAGLQNR